MICAIAACDENGLVGLDGALPWRLPSELRHFRALTIGHAVVMGRRTFESIGCALPERANFVLSRTSGYVAPNARVVHRIGAALAVARKLGDVFIIGGASVFAQALPFCDRAYITRVHARIAVPDGAVATYLPRGWWDAAGVEVARGCDSLAWTAYAIDRGSE